MITIVFFSFIIKAKTITNDSQNESYSPNFSYQRVYGPSDIGDDERKAAKLMDRGIKQIQYLLSKRPNKETKFQLNLRLATMYLEKSTYLKTVELAKTTKTIKTTRKESLSYLYKAIKLYRNLVQNYSNHPEADRVLFSLSFALVIVGSDSSPNYLLRLIKRFPRSNYIPDAHLALGEYYFDKNVINKAITHYRKVLAYKEHRVYTFALYKLAWCYYNKRTKSEKESIKNIKKALAALNLVVRQKNSILKKEAMDDMLIIYADVNWYKQAWQYFMKVATKERFWQMMEKMALIYEKQGNHLDSREIFHSLLKIFPLHPQNPGIVVRFLSHFKQKKEHVKLMALMKYLMSKFNDQSDWYHANKSDTKIITHYKGILKKHLSWCGTYFHNLSQKNKLAIKDKKFYLKSALTCYNGHLDEFPKSKEFYTFSFNSAQIYESIGHHIKAGDKFFEVAQNCSNKKLKEKANISAIQAYLVRANKIKHPKREIKKAPEHVPLILEKLIKVSLAYNRTFSKRKKNVLEYTARVAQIYYEYSQFDSAFLYLNQIIKNFPKSKQASTSVRMILKVSVFNKDWVKTNTLAKKFYNQKELRHPKLKRDLLSIMKTSHFKWAEELESKKSFIDAGNKFKQYQKEFPKDKYASKALYKAALNYQSALEMDKYTKTLIQHNRLFPRSSLNVEALIRLATYYEDITDFRQAARYYFVFAKKHPRHKEGPQSVLNAAIIYRGLEDNQNVYACYNYFYQRYKSKVDTSILFSFAEAALALGKTDHAISIYRELIKTTKDKDIKWLSEIKLHQIYNKTQKKMARKIYRETFKDYQSHLSKSQSTHKVFASTARAIAEKEFNNLQSLKKDFWSIQLKYPSTLGKDLEAKQQKYVTLKNRLLKITHLGDPYYWVLSLYHLGLLNQHMSKELFDAVTPPNLSQDEALQFKSELEKFAFPLEEEAEKFFKHAWENVLKLGVYSPETLKIYQTLSEIDPVNYPPSFEVFDRKEFFYDEMYHNQAIEGLI